jgi:small subunit ribosomal protein S30e
LRSLFARFHSRASRASYLALLTYNFLTSLSKPIVAKQEKKKRPKGRAGKRIVYNRRFVNVVVGPGKKKSPNSNAA